jgi:hypothetical protein
MRERHPVFDADVQPGATVRRYFDLPKFLALLQSKSLYFTRANLLGDPLEGSFTRAREADRQRLLANPPDGKTREYLLRVFEHNASVFAEDRWCTYISCWHLGDHESMAMWRGYGGGSYGIAVRSTFGTLDAVLPPTAGDFPMSNIYLGRVRYVDHSSETTRLQEEANSYAPFVCKSLAYQHEAEVRAVFMDVRWHRRHDAPAGELIPVDLSMLIHGITVSPLADAWYQGVIQDVCSAYDLPVTVERSIVSSAPIF